MDEHRAANRAYWDELAAVHPDTDFYDVEGFLDGESTLRDVEREELADVVGEGTDLLHLQCHFGLDTLSWAREGATVTGVDFSGEAVARARELAAEAGLSERARFLECDVYDLPGRLDDRFDVVFASYGVTAWLSDLDRWAEVAASFLRPGGTFYLADGHPFGAVFGSVDGEDATVEWPYFHEGELEVPVEASYAGATDLDSEVAYEWQHTMGEAVTAVAGAGLVVDHLHEFPKLGFHHFEAMERDDDGWWRLPDGPDLPLTYSLRAHRPDCDG